MSDLLGVDIRELQGWSDWNEDSCREIACQDASTCMDGLADCARTRFRILLDEYGNDYQDVEADLCDACQLIC